MKNINVVLFVFISTLTFGQKEFKINILSTVDYSLLDEFNRDYVFDPMVEYKAPLGASLDISLEMKTSQTSALLTGIRYSKKNYYPDLEITLYYGGRLSYKGDSLWVQLPSLTRLQYQTISIPVSHKFYFKKGNKLSFFTQIGAVIGFQVSKEESFEDNYFGIESEQQINKISARNQHIKLFNTAIEIGGGMNFKIKEDLDLFFQINANLFDFRKADNQLMKIWPQVFENNTTWWKDNILPLGQLSFGIGIQKSLISSS